MSNATYEIRAQWSFLSLLPDSQEWYHPINRTFVSRSSNFCSETGDDSAARLKSSSFNDDISASLLFLVVMLTELRLMPLPLSLQLQSQSQEWDSRGTSHRRHSEKRRNLHCIGAEPAEPLTTWYKDPHLSRVRPGLTSFRGRLGVALSVELTKKVSAHVYAETYLERVSRKSKTLTFRKKSMNSYQPWKPLSVQPISQFQLVTTRAGFLGHKNFAS